MGIINLQGVTKIYQTKEVETVALENVNLEVKAGEFLSVMGPSGCGKSTMLNLIGLLDVPTEGAVTVDGAATGRMKDAEMAEFRNKTLGFVFQSFHLINSLNVLDNVELPLLYRKSTEKSRRETARAVLEKVGLSHRTKHFPSQLSGGQCQRVAIARALIGNPKIILADEPTGNLDPAAADGLMQLLRWIVSRGCAVLMSTHNISNIQQYPSRTLRFNQGRVEEIDMQSILGI